MQRHRRREQEAASKALLEQIQREQSWLAAKEALALLRVAGRFQQHREVTVLDRRTDTERTVVILDESCEEVSTTLHRTMNAVHEQISTARLLDSVLPRTAEALALGRITAQHVRMIAEQARRLSGCDVQLFHDPARDTVEQARIRAAFVESCRSLEDILLPAAEELTPVQTRTLARRAVIAIDPDGHERRRQEARRDIDVEVIPEDDGLALLLARLPIEQAARIKAALDARAQLGAEESALSVGERRAAALVDAVLGNGTDPTTVAKVTTEIQVVIGLDALLGYEDSPATVTIGARQPEPIGAASVRDLVADPRCPVTLRRLVVDPMTGHLLDRGRRSYRVTDALRAFVTQRDGTCRFPGCTRAARICQIDHAVAWDDGGSTDRVNLGPLCVRHHQLKTLGDWVLVGIHPDGTVEWRSPKGTTHYARPPSLAGPD